MSIFTPGETEKAGEHQSIALQPFLLFSSSNYFPLSFKAPGIGKALWEKVLEVLVGSVTSFFLVGEKKAFKEKILQWMFKQQI